MKKHGFTIVETLISLLIISVVGVGITFVLNSYYKTTYSRDMQMKETISALDTVEELKSDVKTLNDLYDFAESRSNLKMVAVGIGEVTLSKTAGGKINVIKSGEDESFVFSNQVKPKTPNIFRITAFGKLPNTSITTIITLRGGS